MFVFVDVCCQPQPQTHTHTHERGAGTWILTLDGLVRVAGRFAVYDSNETTREKKG